MRKFALIIMISCAGVSLAYGFPSWIGVYGSYQRHNNQNPGEFTVRQLAEQVIELTGAKSKIINQPLPPDDPTRRRPDITLAKTRLGWEPKIPLADGLAKTIAWFRSIDMAQYRPPTPNF